jgi:hypothetical protein
VTPTVTAHPSSTGASAATGSTPSREPTVVTTFEPFGTSGLNADITAVRTVTGSCWTGAISSPRPDAWRCNGVGTEYPCFASPYVIWPRVVVCPVFSKEKDPDRVLLINLTQRLPLRYGNSPEDSATASRSPFLIVLSDGTTCALQTGTLDFIGNRPEFAYCLGRETALVGRIDRSQPTWTVSAAAKGSSDLVKLSIAQVFV